MDAVLTDIIPVESETAEAFTRNFAKIGAVYEDGVTLVFDGETEPTEKHYLCNTEVYFKQGDRVRIVEDSGTYIVEYVVGNPRQEKIAGLPSGGAAGQVLTKKSDAQFDAAWSSNRLVPMSGNTGYVLTKTENGYAWLEAPVKVPAGGSTGQVLVKTGTGCEWAEVPGGVPASGTVGYVLTKTSGGHGWAAVNAVPSGGTTGYVLTKTSSGYGWVASAGVPSGGSTGQILTKSSSGYGWANAPAGVPTSGTTGYVLTKTSSGYGWAASDGVPSGGSTGQILTKTSSGFGWSNNLPSQLKNSYNSTNASYNIEIRSNSAYYASPPVFQIRMAGGSWRTITTT